ncbi:Class I SAM-dependent methyltransferase OS=Streptomyces tendae OX=1932 GN=GUR47_02085 PE=4 SV=1 [Streptomyces tendae]
MSTRKPTTPAVDAPPSRPGLLDAVVPGAGPARPAAGDPVQRPAAGPRDGPGGDRPDRRPAGPEGGPAHPATRRPDDAAQPAPDPSERHAAGVLGHGGEGFSAGVLADGRGGFSAGVLADGRGGPSAGSAGDGDGQCASGAGTDRRGRPAGERTTVRLREAPAGARPDDPPRYAPEWLRLREPADAAARAHDLLDPLRSRLAGPPGRADGLVVHDLGCGTGSMGRWLAPLLDGAQHWVLHDRDPYLLHFAAVAAPRTAADGSRVTVETRRGDLARLTPDALTGAALVTASALLDVLTTDEVGTLAAACAAAGCPALLTLSVAGRVDLTPAHPLDAEITEAFNDHQRRTGMLGPDAVTAAADAFAGHGATIRAHPSPWRLGPDEAELTAQWLRGWVGAAVEQRQGLRERADRYLAERLAACAAGELRVVVHHTDLLALCRPTGGAP